MATRAPLTVNAANLAGIARGGIPVPRYDRARLRPRLVHVGVGGFHRAHLALYTHNVAAAGGDWGIVGLGITPRDERMHEVLGRQDHLYTLVERGPGQPAVQVIGSIVGHAFAPPGHDHAIAELVAAPSTKILSLTITESGYAEPAGDEATAFDRIAAALAVRRRADAGPLTILSCDNLPDNGTVARRAALAAAARVDASLPEWVAEHCTFPHSMVDRITPMTHDADRAWLRDAHGIDDGWPVVAEPFRQWVVEDAFAGGRPAWEQDGALVTDRVHEWELYKLRMLNAGHSCIAYLCALADITYVDEAVATPAVRRFLEELLLVEAAPTLTEIPGHPREDYVTSVLERFENTGIRDQIARLCVDGSAKFPTFLVPTIAAQLEGGGPIERGATALAAWARYLGVVDPAEQAFDASGDRARARAAAALAEPVAFLEYREVFPPELRDAERFRAAFTDAYRRVAADGPLAAMEAAGVRMGAG